MKQKKKGRAKLCADRHGMYYDGLYSKIYVGNQSMIDKELKAITMSKEAMLGIEAIHGKDIAMNTPWGVPTHGPIFQPTTRGRCPYCNDLGVWPEDNHIPLTSDENTLPASATGAGAGACSGNVVNGKCSIDTRKPML